MCRRANRGVTLVELIVFIVIVGVAMAGLFAAFNTITAASADPQVRKQVLAIAESLMEEVQLMPFTFCDPDDPKAADATNSGTGAGGCTSTATSEDTLPLVAEGGETRYTSANPFDNVSDYNGAPIGPGIRNIDGNGITGLEAYSAAITVAQAGLASAVDPIVAADALKITVVVTGPSGVSVTLEGYRTRYAPNTLP